MDPTALLKKVIVSGIYDKTWRLGHSMVYVLYPRARVISSVLTYAASVWWPRMLQNQASQDTKLGLFVYSRSYKNNSYSHDGDPAISSTLQVTPEFNKLRSSAKG